ncbi:MAG: MMPL family transporter [Acidobacteriota bacterium]|nr:MMPL family transporter [Acidobacteriota bacterium]
MRRLLARLAGFTRRRYKVVFAGFALLLFISLYLLLHLSFDTDMLNLLPRKDPAVRSYIEMLQDFGSNTYLLVAIRLPEGAVAEPYEALADDLAGRLGRLPDVKSVQHRIGDPVELLETFFPKSVLFLDVEGRSKLVAKLTDAGIKRRVSELRRQLATPQGLAVKELIKLDPLGLSDVFLGRIDSSRGSLNVDWTSGYYLSRDHRLLLILVEPVRPPQDIPFDERLTAAADREIAAALGRWSEIAGPGGPPRPAVDVGGPYLTALGDATLIKRDMAVNVVTSGLAVFVLFLLVFRRAGALLYAFVPLLSGLLLTFGFAALAFGALSSATSVCAALLIGLGIDFVIVSYGRYVEERRRGKSLEEALEIMLGACGTAVIAGALTTAGTFYAFTFTSFIGLRQMGLLTGTGILFCMLSVLLLLPSMLAWSEDRGRRRRSQPRLSLYSFGIHRLTALSLRYPAAVMVAALLLTVACLATVPRLRFDESMKTMRPTGRRGADVSTEVARRFGSGFDTMIVALSGDSLGEVLALAEHAAEGAQRLVDRGVLYGFSGPTSLIPAPRQQTETLAWLRRERSGALDLERIRRTFSQAVAGEGLRSEPFAPGFDLLARAVNLSSPIGLADLSSTPQTKLVLDRYLKRKAKGWIAAVYLYPPSGLWRREAPPGALALARELGPRAQLAGVNVVNQRVRSMVLRDAWIAGGLGLLLVAIILWFDFHSIRAVALALTPLMVGITWMIGGMVAFGIQMNFINIFVTTMIIGIGTDYGIYILHRYFEVRDLPAADFAQGMRETGKAVATAALSTIVGFGSITFSHYPGLQSTGKVAILGALFTSLVAVTLLPAYLSSSEEARRLKAGRKE